jgi:RNA polymerase sigma factor (sigma-70 family)
MMAIDRDEFEHLVSAHWSRLLSTARLLGWGTADAEDLVQTTMLRACMHWHRLRSAERPEAYLTRILINSSKSEVRKRSAARRRIRAQAMSPGLPVESAGDTAVFLEALSRLPYAHREVLVLRYYLDLDVATVADLVRAPMGTVKSRCARALATLENDMNIQALAGRGDSHEA